MKQRDINRIAWVCAGLVGFWFVGWVLIEVVKPYIPRADSGNAIARKVVLNVYNQQRAYFKEHHVYVASRGRRRNCDYIVIPRNIGDALPDDPNECLISKRKYFKSEDMKTLWFVLLADCDLNIENLSYAIIGTQSEPDLTGCLSPKPPVPAQ